MAGMTLEDTLEYLRQTVRDLVQDAATDERRRIREAVAALKSSDCRGSDAADFWSDRQEEILEIIDGKV